MSPQLRAMLVGVGVFALGVGMYVYTPQPATRTMAELRDAGGYESNPMPVIKNVRADPNPGRFR